MNNGPKNPLFEEMRRVSKIMDDTRQEVGEIPEEVKSLGRSEPSDFETNTETTDQEDQSPDEGE